MTARLRGGPTKSQSACKPGSVWLPCRSSGNVAAIHLGRRSRAASCNLPERRARKQAGTPFGAPCRSYSVLLPVGFAMPSPLPETRWALTPPFHPCPLRGGLLSVALSLGFPPPDVIRHRVSMEPGLSSPRCLSAIARRGCPADWRAFAYRSRERISSTKHLAANQPSGNSRAGHANVTRPCCLSPGETPHMDVVPHDCFAATVSRCS